MPRYSLRTLIVVMLLGGPALAGAWFIRRFLLLAIPFSILAWASFRLLPKQKLDTPDTRWRFCGLTIVELVVGGMIGLISAGCIWRN